MPSLNHTFIEPRLMTEAQQLVSLREKLERENLRIVTINGCFDLIHSGHLHILEAAAAQGDIVIVGLNSDASVRLNKGPLRPIIQQEERAALLLALRWVDYVYVYPEKDCMEFIRLARPHVHVNDASYGPDCIEAETVRAVGARLHLVDKKPTASTTDIVKSILERYCSN